MSVVKNCKNSVYKNLKEKSTYAYWSIDTILLPKYKCMQKVRILKYN